MRNNSTKVEIKFWCELLRSSKSGYKFNRQKILLNYIVDFYCAKLKLIIEIDGTSHSEKEIYDKIRDTKLEALGLKIIRYEDLGVINDFEKIEADFYNQIKLREKEML